MAGVYVMLNKRDVIEGLMKFFDLGLTEVIINEWTFVFDPFTGYYANDGEKFYKSFDDLAGMVEDMFNDGCFND
jgi:type VI protein secretion system component VasK